MAVSERAGLWMNLISWFFCLFFCTFVIIYNETNITVYLSQDISSLLDLHTFLAHFGKLLPECPLPSRQCSENDPSSRAGGGEGNYRAGCRGGAHS